MALVGQAGQASRPSQQSKTLVLTSACRRNRSLGVSDAAVQELLLVTIPMKEQNAFIGMKYRRVTDEHPDDLHGAALKLACAGV